MQILGDLLTTRLRHIYYPAHIQSYQDEVVVSNNGKIWYQLNTDNDSKFIYHLIDKKVGFSALWDPIITSKQFVFSEGKEDNSYQIEAATTPSGTITELIYEDVPEDWKPTLDIADTLSTYVKADGSIRESRSLSYKNTTINTGVSSSSSGGEEVSYKVFIDKILSSNKIVVSVINDKENTENNQYFVLNDDEKTWTVIDDATMKSYGDPVIRSDRVYVKYKSSRFFHFDVEIEADLAAKVDRLSYPNEDVLKPHFIHKNEVIRVCENQPFSYEIKCDNVSVNYSKS